MLLRARATSTSSEDAPRPPLAQRYRSSPLATPEMPTGITNIISNEAAERFSFYGMKCILVVFMTSHLRDAQRQPAYLSEKVALVYYHSFTSAVYLTPLGGALLAEAVLGKYRTVVYLSLVYCGGHLALAINETRTGDCRQVHTWLIASGGHGWPLIASDWR
jgi:POT family proton-dependent oligopeptide transporter